MKFLTNHPLKQFVLLSLCTLFFSTARADLTYTGITLAGAEFGENRPLPGTYDRDYIYPFPDEITEFVSRQGMNTLRLPFRWERVQPVASGDFNPVEIQRIKDFLRSAEESDAWVIVDPHNYGRFYGDIIGESGVTVADFADFWRKLAVELRGFDNALFSLINEPHDQDTNIMVTAFNAAIQAIRDTGATQTIFVPGNHWSGAHYWLTGNPSNSEAMLNIVDPLNKMVFVAHQYLDSDHSGSSPECVSTTIGSERLADFTNWLRLHNKKGIIEEFGGGDNATCVAALEDMLDHIDDNDDVYVGWVYWASGPWWGNDYELLVRPQTGAGLAQLEVLKRHLSSGSAGDPPPEDEETRLVAVTTNGYAIYLTNGTRQWIDPSCVSRLVSVGVDPQTELWSDVAPLPIATQLKTCSEIEARLTSDCPPQGCSDPALTVALVSDGGDGFLLLPNSMRQWLSWSCIDQLRSAGVPLTPTPWEQVRDLAVTDYYWTCDAVESRMLGGDSGGGDGGSNGGGDGIYFNDFSTEADGNRIDQFVAYRDPFVVNHLSGSSDHLSTGGINCSAPEQTRTQSRNNPSAHVYQCLPDGDPASGHQMAFAMDTSGYGFTGALPDQVFEGVREVSVDINTTTAGSRNFVEIKVIPVEQVYVNAMPCIPDLPCNDGWDYDDIGGVGAGTNSQEGTGLTIATPSQPDGLRFDHYNAERLSNGDYRHALCSGTNYCFRVATHENNIGIRERYAHIFRDNGNGTLSFGIEQADNTFRWVEAPGSFPQGPVRIVVAFHNYTGTKDGNGPGYNGNVSPSTGGFTWHWDNLSVDADTATPSLDYFGGSSADRIVTPNGCIAFAQGQRTSINNRDVTARFHCTGDDDLNLMMQGG